MSARRNIPAMISLLFGWAALACAWTGAPGPTVLAIPLGVLALILLPISLWRARRIGAQTRGRIRSVAGGAIGTLGLLLSFSTINRFTSGQARQEFRDAQMRHVQQIVSRGTMPREDATNFTSNLPIIVLRTGGQSISDELSVIRGTFIDVTNGTARIESSPQHEGPLSIHYRGSTTRQLPKHSFTFHTLNKKEKQTKVALLGLPAEEDWVLYAPLEDKSMIRDVLAYDLSRAMGHYAPRTRYVELFITRSDGRVSMRDYAGVYVLMEKIKRSPERVNIAKLQPEDENEPEISGGYILKRDHSEGDGGRFRTQRGGPWFYVAPNDRQITAAQKSWIKNYMESFENALHGPDFADPEKGYAAFLDVGAFIDMHWLIELSKNVDGFRYSAFVTKDRGGKLQAGPAWDWNRSFGNANYYGGEDPQSWYWPNLRPREISWYRRLKQDPAFARRAAERWRELRKTVLATANLDARIDGFASEIKQAQQRNFKRWPVLGVQITCNFYVGQTWEDEVNWLKKWIHRRVEWMDREIERGEKSNASGEE